MESQDQNDAQNKSLRQNFFDKKDKKDPYHFLYFLDLTTWELYEAKGEGDSNIGNTAFLSSINSCHFDEGIVPKDKPYLAGHT
jgi:hypothetical protein